MNINNNNNNKLTENQSLFDSYNNFIISDDRNVFYKMVMRIKLYNMVSHLHGDIVECGVFKGSGLVLWMKIISMYEPHSIKKVIGFDFFDPTFVDGLKDETDRKMMQQVFDRCDDMDSDDISLTGIKNKIKKSGFEENKFELVKGDISITSAEYIKDRPGFRISLLYLDLDIEEPTTDTLNNLWDIVLPGGLVVFDEYAYHKWSESNAVDIFIKENNLTLINTNIQSPTAYIIKPT